MLDQKIYTNFTFNFSFHLLKICCSQIIIQHDFNEIRKQSADIQCSKVRARVPRIYNLEMVMLMNRPENHKQSWTAGTIWKGRHIQHDIDLVWQVMMKVEIILQTIIITIICYVFKSRI